MKELLKVKLRREKFGILPEDFIIIAYGSEKGISQRETSDK